MSTNQYFQVRFCPVLWTDPENIKNNREIPIKTEGVVGFGNFSIKLRQIPMKTESEERFLILVYRPTDRRKAMTIGLLATGPKKKIQKITKYN